MATRLFGAEVTPERVIGETLTRATDGHGRPARGHAGGRARSPPRPTAAPAVRRVRPRPARSLDRDDVRPRRRDRARAGCVRARAPTTVPEAAAAAGRADRPRRRRRAGDGDPRDPRGRARGSGTRRPAARSSRSGCTSSCPRATPSTSSLEPEDARYITGTYQVCVPGQPGQGAAARSAFCRECGQEYLVVAKADPQRHVRLRRRAGTPTPAAATATTGYLYVGVRPARGRTTRSRRAGCPTPGSSPTDDRPGRRPATASGSTCPDEVCVRAGRQRSTRRGAGLQAWFVPTPFAFCLRCGVSYEQVRGQRLRQAGHPRRGGPVVGRHRGQRQRSSARLRAVAADELDAEARKLLTFTDNRQDASLQAGHFNDFVQVGPLRGALYRAAAAGPGGLTHEIVAQRVTDALGLPMRRLRRQPRRQVRARKADAERALRDVLGYRLYRDLQRGWRITMPNLEQTGLLQIDYVDLDELAADDDAVGRLPTCAARTPPAQREELAPDPARRAAPRPAPSTSTASPRTGFERLQPRVRPAPASARGRCRTTSASSTSAPRYAAAGPRRRRAAAT